MSFFTKARERAEAAAQQLQAHASGASQTSAGGSSQSNFSYTGAVPHLLRQGLASVDPRYEANRQFHLLSQAVKSLNIDHEAAGRESKNLAKATFNWGQSHLPENREDNVGDEMLVDVSDRLAYIWHEIGQLEVSHSQRSEQARTKLKRFEKSEMELSARRLNRIKLKRELHALVPERAKVNGADRANDVEKRLQALVLQDQADEEALSQMKRESVQDGYGAMFDSLIELGEKLALVARYGKLLTNEIPTAKAVYPATIKARGPTIPLWQGATKTAEIRAAVAPALAAHKSDPALPVLSLSSDASGSSSLGRSDTVSYSVSHRSELETDDKAAMSTLPPSTSGERRSSIVSDRPVSSTKDAEGPGHRLNLSPSVMPAPPLPPRDQAKVDQPRSPGTTSGNPFVDQPDNEEVDQSPPGPTVAETGLVPSGTGGPKSGVLRPRRASGNQRSASISAGAVAYLGPPGTYTHQAVMKLFGDQGTTFIPMPSITGAIDFVRRGTPGKAKIAVVPVENSTFGPVRDTIDNLLSIGNGERHAVDPSQGAKVHVIGETCLAIDHALMCGPKTYHHLLSLQGETDPNALIRDDILSNITNVISHEQALGQCSLYLSRYMPQARKKAVESTAAAASTALEFESGTAPGCSSTSVSHAHESLGFSSQSLVVAIGSVSATENSPARVLRTGIQDVEDNRTRFFVLSSEPVETLLATHTLPDALSRLYTADPAAAVGRALLRMHDPLRSDLSIEKSEVAGAQTGLSYVMDELTKRKDLVVRKVDRRPAAFYASQRPGSVWKSSYLFELQYPASDLTNTVDHIKQMVENLSFSTNNATANDSTVDYLGSWIVDAQALKGGQQARGQTSGAAPLSSGPVLAASGSSFSKRSDTAQMGERESKELEAKAEAEEAQRLAAQARFARDQQQGTLYGAPAEARLGGLQESSDEAALPADVDEGLPAYQAMDPSTH